MVRDFRNGSQLKINVYFRPTEGSPICGLSCLGMDIPNQPISDNHNTVSFWEGDKLMVYPMDMIDHCELYYEV